MILLAKIYPFPAKLGPAMQHSPIIDKDDQARCQSQQQLVLPGLRQIGILFQRCIVLIDIARGAKRRSRGPIVHVEADSLERSINFGLGEDRIRPLEANIRLHINALLRDCRKRRHGGRPIQLQRVRALKPVNQNGFPAGAAVPFETVKDLDPAGIRKVRRVRVGCEVLVGVGGVAARHIRGERPHGRTECGRHWCADSTDEGFRVGFRDATATDQAESKALNV